MFAPDCQQRVHVAVLFLAAGCLFSAAVYSRDGNHKTPPALPSSLVSAALEPPPVEQALVPESVFAMRLAEALKLGAPENAAQAEALLSGLGIEPENGWISDFPVTPSVLGEIEASLAAAVDQGKLGFGREQALRLLREVKTRLGLDVTSAPQAPSGQIPAPDNKAIYRYRDADGLAHYTDVYDAIPEAYRDSVRILTPSTAPALSGGPEGGAAEPPAAEPAPPPPPAGIEDYYDEQGPPAVTYYTPPAPYGYLYSWMPYPFWSTGVYFPGFFVLNNFHKPVFLGRQRYFVRHHGEAGEQRHPFRTGSVKPMPEKGRRPAVRLAPSPRFSGPAARSGAQAILSRSPHRQGRARSTAKPAAPRVQAPSRPLASPQERRSRDRQNRTRVLPWDTAPKASRRNRAPTAIPWDPSPGESDRRPTPHHRSVPAQRPLNRSIQIPRRLEPAPFRREDRLVLPPRRPIGPSYSVPRSGAFGGRQAGAGSRRGGGAFGNGGARGRGRR
jgi:hypothetical protein